MAFFANSFRARIPVGAVGGAVFAVGWRAYVTAASAPGPGRRVRLMDDAGGDVSDSVAAGTEVEILAWRPLAGAGARYRVRSTSNGLEGWLPAGNLRKPSAAPAPARRGTSRSEGKRPTTKSRSRK